MLDGFSHDDMHDIRLLHSYYHLQTGLTITISLSTVLLKFLALDFGSLVTAQVHSSLNYF